MIFIKGFKGYHFSTLRPIIRIWFILCWMILFKSMEAMPLDSIAFAKRLDNIQRLMDKEEYAKAVSLAQPMLSEEGLEDHWYLNSSLLHLLGDCALETGAFEQALNYFQASQINLDRAGQRNSLLMAEVWNKIGRYYQETKAFKLALEYFEKAMNIRSQLLDLRHLKVADSFNNIGICRYQLGDYAKSLELHDQALAIRLEHLQEPHPLLGQSYSNIGLCLQNQGDLKLAEYSYLDAIRNYQENGANQAVELADVFLNLGTLYWEMDQADQSKNYQEKALKIYQTHLDPKHPDIATCISNLANISVISGQFAKADQLYREALGIRQEHFGEVHPDVAQTLYNIGVANFLRGEEKNAVQFLLQCFKALNYQASEEDKPFEKVNDQLTLLQVFQTLALAYRDYAIRTDSIQYEDLALQRIRNADQLIDFMRNQYQASASKLDLADRAHQIYELGIDLAFDLHEHFGASAYLEQGFHFSEKSKGILLLESLYQTKAAEFSSIPGEKIEAIDALEAQMTDLEKQIYLVGETGNKLTELMVDSLRNQLFSSSKQLDELLEDIKISHPKYFQLRYATTTLPIEHIQKELISKKQSMLEFFRGEENLFIFVINKNDFKGIRLPISEELPINIWILQNAIRRFPVVPVQQLQQNLEQYASAAFAVYEDLIKPVEVHLQEELIIIPDEELAMLPFTALLSAYPEQIQQLKSYEYLLKKYLISYNYSANLYQEMLHHPTPSGMKSYLGLAPTFGTDNAAGLTPLHYNQSEIEEVNTLMKGTMLQALEASKAAFLERQADYRIIHLATHGKAHSGSGDFSFLGFAGDSITSLEGMKLFVREIYNLQTNSEMIVLSACETGIGELQTGEGMASIARSFSYAGAQSLMATQWSVDDKATKELVRSFFENIKKGLPKDRALRDAQLEFLLSHGTKEAHPYFWAAMIPIGNMTPIGKSIPWFWIGLGLGAFFLVLLIRGWRKKKVHALKQ